jgi:cyclic pyranopterin phosphate synthase
MTPPSDRLGRRLGALRLSVTDKCNLRCDYCMPRGRVEWLPREALLSFEELETLVGCFLELGVSRLRLTGGEPLLRADVPKLVRRLTLLPGLRDLALTSNGVTLARHAQALAAAGLSRLTISLDSLDPNRFRTLSLGKLERVLAGIRAAAATGLPLKLNTVVLRGTNDDELNDLLEFAAGLPTAQPVEVRFVEYMAVGPCEGSWDPARVFTRAQILERIEARRGPARPLPGRGVAPAERFVLGDGTTFGIIGATTAPFCGACDRARLTANGQLYLCLHGRESVDLGGPLRQGASPAELRELIASAWSQRADRGAELLAQRGRPLPLSASRLPMHAIGG